jgi:signal transduction histidine kinase
VRHDEKYFLMARWHSLWIAPAAAPDLEQELNVERLMTMSRHQPLAAAAHSLMSLALVLAVSVPTSPFLVCIVAAMQIAALVQVSIWQRHRRKSRPARVADRTLTRIILWTVMWGLLWGTLTASLVQSGHGRDCALLGVTIMGMAAGGVGMLTAIPAAAVAFLATSMLPPATVLLTMGGKPEILFSLFLLASAVFMTLSVRQNYISFLNHLRLRLLTARLAVEAEAASQAKTRLVANMGHELRTPLNAVIGFAEMIAAEMKGAIGPRDYLEFARAIVQGGRQLRAVIDDILDLSKFEAGLGKSPDVEIGVAVLVEHALSVIRPAGAQHNIAIHCDVDPHLPAIRVDMDRIHQVLVGLLSNAVAFSNPGGRIDLDVSFAPHARHEPAAGVLFRIIDYGTGIPTQDLTDILTPFVWTRDATHHQIPGTGLKLPLADQIIRAHGGVLKIESVVGRGTVASFVLPQERLVGYRSSGTCTMRLAAGTPPKD